MKRMKIFQIVYTKRTKIFLSGINVYEKDQKGQTALDLVDAHKAKQKSYMEIKTAIIGRLS